jgi:DNA-binding transcriptional LysR family regulator
MVLSINRLRSFYAAAKRESISRAAEELMVSPPAITSQIKQLEEDIGTRLLIRSGNSMRLTDAGSAVFGKIRKIFEDIDNFELFISDISLGNCGELKIGCSETAAIYVMPQFISPFQHTYPGVKVIIDRGTTAEMVRNLFEYKNELVVISYMPNDKRIRMRLMGKKEIVFIASFNSEHLQKDYISIEELNTIPFIVPNDGSATRDIIFEYLNRFTVYPKIMIETTSIALTKSLVMQDKGISFVCRDGVIAELEDKCFREIHITGFQPYIEYGIGYLNRNDLSAAARAFLKLIEMSNK